MKKILTFVLPILIVTFVVYFFRSEKFDQKILGTFSETEEEVVSLKNDVEIPYKDGVLKAHWFEAETAHLTLIPNFEKPLTSKEAFLEYGCKSLANGGFISKQNSPIGLFIYEDGILSPFQKNNLFNGILSVNHLDTPRITRDQPRDILRIGLQSGPLIKENAKYQNVVSNDEKARRVVAFTTGENKLYFATIYDPKSSYLGPTLSDLPNILAMFEEKSGLIIADALNLDGGNHSSFIDGEFDQSEISFSGSFFCEQE